MKAKYFNLEKNIKISELEQIGEEIKNGKIVIFPTETVYGIGTNALDEKACARIFNIKGRSTGKALIVLVSNYEMLENIAMEINQTEKKLMEKFWPGALTIILKKKDIIPDIVTGGGKDVGVRMTSGGVARLLIEKSKVPIVAPSANLSGEQTGVSPKVIMKKLGDKVDYVIDIGDIKSDLTSTIVKVEDNKIRILREGKITKEKLNEIAEITI